MTAGREAPEAPRIPAQLRRTFPECDAAGHLELEVARVETGADETPLAARSLDVAESDLTGVTLGAQLLRQLDVRDSILRLCDLSNVAPRKGSIRRAELRQSRFVGFALTEGDVQDVQVVGGTMMLASFAQSSLRRVVFEEVNMREVSFAEAGLDGVAFLRCDLAGADFRGATLCNCLMRGTTLDAISGVGSLRGLTMPWPDLVASAGALAGALGIAPEEDRPTRV